MKTDVRASEGELKRPVGPRATKSTSAYWEIMFMMEGSQVTRRGTYLLGIMDWVE